MKVGQHCGRYTAVRSDIGQCSTFSWPAVEPSNYYWKSFLFWESETRAEDEFAGLFNEIGDGHVIYAPILVHGEYYRGDILGDLSSPLCPETRSTPVVAG